MKSCGREVQKNLQEELLGMNILVVDDFEDNRDLIVTLLEDQGYKNFLEAEDGKKALEILESNEVIDLVLLDINMPKMNGYEVLDYMKSHDQLLPIPVIMVTAVDQQDSVLRCIEKGAEDYLTKPVEETLMWARVHASLERKYLRNKERQLLKQVQSEKRKSEEILYHVIPESVAERLRRGEESIADTIDDATVLFADLVGFTALSATVNAASLVHMLNYVFRAFDEFGKELKLEKIKTIGDSYMIVGGIPPNTEDHQIRCMQFANKALDHIDVFNENHGMNLQLRVGLHSGPVVAGVIGQTRFTYDLWGETVNLASRMETLGVPGRVQVTQSTYERLQSRFDFEPRGKIDVKGKGEMETYLSLAPSLTENARMSLQEPEATASR